MDHGVGGDGHLDGHGAQKIETEGLRRALLLGGVGYAESLEEAAGRIERGRAVRPKLVQSGRHKGCERSPEIANKGVVEVARCGGGTIRVGHPSVSNVGMCVQANAETRAIVDGDEQHFHIDITDIDAATGQSGHS